MNLSTAFMRRYYDQDVCPVDKTPCFVYSTLPENALNDVFINFHVNLDSCSYQICNPKFEYAEGSFPNDHEDFSNWEDVRVVQADYRSPVTEFSQRGMFTALVKGMKADTTYSFRITEPNWNNENAQIYTYKTFNTKDMTIINGGDVGNSVLAHEVIENSLREANADLVMIGGDIAYDQNDPKCFRAWDYLLRSLPISVLDNSTNTIRVVPVLFSTGNHDLGATSYSPVVLRENEHEPVFKHFFPQNTANGEVPMLKDKKVYFSQSFGDDLLIVNLDAAYALDMKGEQTQWLEKVLSESNAKVKLAQYHGPLYSACRQDKWNDHQVENDGKRHWAPLFDKYNMTISFENHSHAFKRSKRIKGEKANPDGTLYLGEGSWGVLRSPGSCEKDNVELMDVILEVSAAWIVRIQPDEGIDSKAFDNKGNFVDSYYLKLDD